MTEQPEEYTVNISVEEKRALIEAKRAMIARTIYDVGLDAKVAAVLGTDDKEQMRANKERVKRLIEAQELLEKMLQEL